jgi:hypothetical protein
MEFALLVLFFYWEVRQTKAEARPVTGREVN